MSKSDHKLEVRNLFKIFGKDPEGALERLDAGSDKETVLRDTGCVVGVSDVSFDVAAGEIFVVMGLSGSGKSTLVRCVNRLITPTRGEVRVNGEDVVAMDNERLRQMRLERMSMVFQHFALFPHMTVAENVAFGLKIQGVDVEQRRGKALKALELVGLEDWADSPPSNLSGGMQQRVGLARGLAVDPEILLMDEPFSALDPLIRRDMQLELVELQRSIGNSIIFITHDLHEALILGDRIAIMKDGRFVQVGTPEEIVTRPADDYVSEFTQDIDRGRVLRIGSVSRRAETLVLDSGSPGSAEARLRETGADAVYVVDRDGKAVGVITREALAGKGRGAGRLSDVMTREFPRTNESSRLIDAYEACSKALPLAVVDDDGKLKGTVTAAAVLEALANGAGESESGGQADDTPHPPDQHSAAAG